MTFFTKYERPPRSGEINSGENKVETGSYRPTNKVIENMILAGKRLEVASAGYEFQPGEVVPDDYSDPTRDPGYDLSDASRDLAGAAQRLADAKAAVDAASKAIASPGASEGMPVETGQPVVPAPEGH